MIEAVGNLWTYGQSQWARAITTNGFVKRNGECIMGRGCALEYAKQRPEVPALLGALINEKGNHVFCIQRASRVFTFPAKHRWWEPADMALIERSATELAGIVDALRTKGVEETVVIPRPGCGNGRLCWPDVRVVLEPIFDDRFHIITWA